MGCKSKNFSEKEERGFLRPSVKIDAQPHIREESPFALSVSPYLTPAKTARRG